MEKIHRIWILVLSFFIVTSCAKGIYIGRLAWGEANIIWRSVPVHDVLGDEGVPEGVKEKIKLVQDVKRFSQEKLGLSIDRSYESFFNVKSDTLLYLLSACPKDSLNPYTWSFPIVGKVSYKSFFKKDYALKEQGRLETMGLDTCLQKITAFSTLGWLSDPIYSTIVDQHPVIITNIIIHELVHNTIFFKDETEFNEQIASFIGEKGGLIFIEERFGCDSPYYHLAFDLALDEELVARFIQQLNDDLKGLYDQDVPWEEKMMRREKVFTHGQRMFAEIATVLNTEYFLYLGKERFNNASIVLYRHYFSPPSNVIQQVYDALGCDMRNFIDFLKCLKRMKKSPYRYMEEWLRKRTCSPSG